MKLLRKVFPKFMSRKYSVRTQLFGIAAFFICIGSFAILIANSQLIPLLYTMRLSNHLLDISEQVEVIMYNSVDFYDDMSVVEKSNNIEVEILNRSGHLLYDSEVSRVMQGWKEGEEFSVFDVLRSRNLKMTSHKALRNCNSLDRLVDTDTGLQYMRYTSIAENGNIIKLYAQMNYLGNAANATTRYVSIIAIATFALIMISLYFYLFHFTRPLLEMNKITRAMAKMDFSQKCPPYNNNEIGELGQSINVLSSSLDSTLRDLQKKNEQLEADIEHERRIEKMRKEFVSNASHELKTPIAIIQGYAEGLKLGIKSNRAGSDEYCDIIIEETHKMNRLVCDMLELSKYESGAYELKPRIFEVKKFIEESIDTYDILAQENGIRITKEIPEGLIAYGDPDKLDMVIHNYVSNALAHAKGEKIIRLTAQEHEEFIRIAVYNTGDHIAENELDSIWQSFYRSDKAHSRAEGRFGIGLSIVKAIQELHGMPYSVENTEGGVTFTFDIKKAEETDNGTENQS